MSAWAGQGELLKRCAEVQLRGHIYLIVHVTFGSNHQAASLAESIGNIMSIILKGAVDPDVSAFVVRLKESAGYWTFTPCPSLSLGAEYLYQSVLLLRPPLRETQRDTTEEETRETETQTQSLGESGALRHGSRPPPAASDLLLVHHPLAYKSHWLSWSQLLRT